MRVTLKPGTYCIGDPKQILERSVWQELKEEDNSDIIEYNGHEVCWLAVPTGTFYSDEEDELDIISGAVVIVPESLASNSDGIKVSSTDGLRIILKHEILEVGNLSFDLCEAPFYDEDDALDDSFGF